MFNDTITVYQHEKATEKTEEHWKRTVINGCMWSEEIVKANASDGTINVSKVVNITIPASARADRRYIDYRLYASQTAQDEFFTLNPTTNMDVVVLGACEAEITAEYTLSMLLREHISATISSVNDNAGDSRRYLKNIKVVAK